MKEKFANASLITLALLYIIMLGGGNYEQLNVTSLVASAPPKSFYMLQGPYGFNPVKFCVIFRPLTILLFIIALISNWNHRGNRRKLLLLSFSVDIAITIATFTYFAPETGIFAGAPYHENGIDQVLLERTQLWKNLNFIRLAAFYFSSLLLLVALTSNSKYKELEMSHARNN